MKDNRRDFIRKSASLAAAVSVTGFSSCSAPGKKDSLKNVPAVNRKEVQWPVTFGQNKPKICMLSSLDKAYMRKSGR
jgi:hypothetical protein